MLTSSQDIIQEQIASIHRRSRQTGPQNDIKTLAAPREAELPIILYICMYGLYSEQDTALPVREGERFSVIQFAVADALGLLYAETLATVLFVLGI